MIDDAVNQLRRLDEELETILTSFDTSYAWNYGSVKDGLRDLYEPAQIFRRMLFARVVPNLKRLGLLTPRLRAAFERLGILEFEDADPAADDRALCLA